MDKRLHTEQGKPLAMRWASGQSASLSILLPWFRIPVVMDVYAHLYAFLVAGNLLLAENYFTTLHKGINRRNTKIRHFSKN